MKKVAFISLTILMGCSHFKNKLAETFIVPQDTLPVHKVNGNGPPPPPPIRNYYLPFNFIIDTSGGVFFYKREYWRWCGTGIDWNTPPEFINLKPGDLLRIPEKCVVEFIELNVLKIESVKRWISIAATRDTIQSMALATMFEIFKNKANEVKWTFRRATQEEEIVLEFKKKNTPYYPENISWDSARIILPIK